MSAAEVVSIYAGRWAIEVTYRDVKQLIGGQQPQSWKGDGPERAAGLSFWVHGAVWLWYLDICGDRPILTAQEWNTNKRAASLLDALAQLRRVLWRERISPASQAGRLSPEMTAVLVEALATAA